MAANNKTYMILKDKTNIELEEMAGKRHAVVICNTDREFQRIWNRLKANDNLSEVEITEDGVTVSRIADLVLAGTQTVTNPDNNTITGHFYFDAGSYIPDEYAEAGRILLGEEG